MIKNIIFDLGGVILNIDYNKTSEEFKRLGIKNFDELYSQVRQSGLFDNLEKGLISESEFRNELRRLSGVNLSDKAIDKAWNAMLLDLPAGRIEILLEAKKHYRTFLLSNTNIIHLKAYTSELKRVHKIDSLGALFEKEFFSHYIRRRKPDYEAFEYVIKETGINPAETLFIDDSPQHIEGAKRAGLLTFFMDRSKGLTLDDIFENGKLIKHISDG